MTGREPRPKGGRPLFPARRSLGGIGQGAGECRLGRAMVVDAAPQPSLEEAEGDQGPIAFALAVDHRIEVAVPTDVGGFATVEDVVVSGAGVGLPPDHPCASVPLAEDLVQPDPDVGAHRFIADEKQGPAGFEDSMQIVQRGCDPVKVGSNSTLPAILSGVHFLSICPTTLVDPVGKEGWVQVDEINALGREAAK